MKTWKRVLVSFVVGLVLSLASVVAYAACDDFVWVADNPDNCRMYHRYNLVYAVTGGDVEICVYTQTGTTDMEDGPCDVLP